ncbi:hypothetical protein BGZ72_001469, partial [Mortierella alpina]
MYIASLWPTADPHEIKILVIDAGQAFVFGAYAHLPESHQNTDPAQEHEDKLHNNLAVNQKAVLQPVFRHRRWLQEEKNRRPEGPERQVALEPDIALQSISEIESQLPSLRGPGASVVGYVTKLEEVEGRLLDFYAGENNRFLKHSWDMTRAKHKEYQAIANSLLGVVGGSIGEQRKSDNPVLIGVGLGDFSSAGRLSNLHTSFLSYFIRL